LKERARRTRAGTLRVRVLDPVDVPAEDSGALPAVIGETRARMQKALDDLGGKGNG